MEDLRACYSLIGVELDASLEEIRQAYVDSIKVWHPDRFGGDPRLQRKAEEKTQEINEAYRRIKCHLSHPVNDEGGKNPGSAHYSSAEQHGTEFVNGKVDSFQIRATRIKPLISIGNVLFLLLFIWIILSGGAGGLWIISLLAGICYNSIRGEAVVARRIYIGLTIVSLFIHLFARLQEAKEQGYAAQDQKLSSQSNANIEASDTSHTTSIIAPEQPVRVLKPYNGPEYAPPANKTPSDAQKEYEAKILSKHPDAFEILHDVEEWVDSLPPKKKKRYNWVLDHGNAQEVIKLYDEYKSYVLHYGRDPEPATKSNTTYDDILKGTTNSSTQ